MIVQCSACRGLVEIGAVRVDPEASQVGLSCPECGETTWLAITGTDGRAPNITPPAPEPMAIKATPSVGGEGALSPTAIAAIERELPEASEAEADLKEVFCRHLRESWTDETAHKRLVQRAALKDQLAAVGQCYRSVLEHIPNEPMAKRGQELVLAQAMTQLDRFDREVPASRPGRAIVLFLVTGFVFGAVAFLVRSLSNMSAP